MNKLKVDQTRRIEEHVRCHFPRLYREVVKHPGLTFSESINAMLEAGHPYLTSIAVELKLLGKI